jgi:circadian clock protein KaiC
LRSGIGGLDALLEGGPLYGTATILIGPAGSGKSTLAMQWVLAAAKQGGNSAVYVFDERLGTLLGRVAQLGMDLRPFIDAGRIALEQIDPAELSPGEFVHKVRHQVENRGARIVVIDTLNGYFNAMPEERTLVLQLHELLSYLNQQGVATFLILAQHGLIGQVSSPLDLSYMSDTVLLLRFFETEGRVRKCLAVVKHRGGGHEDTIRELRIGRTGIEIGEPLTVFRGVLTGTPAYTGATDPLLSNGDGGSRHGGNIPI